MGLGQGHLAQRVGLGQALLRGAQQITGDVGWIDVAWGRSAHDQARRLCLASSERSCWMRSK